jgi:hypothetical protein
MTQGEYLPPRCGSWQRGESTGDSLSYRFVPKNVEIAIAMSRLAITGDRQAYSDAVEKALSDSPEA